MQNISSQDFYQETHFNPETKNQIWMSQIADSHDNICNCNHPFAHLLASIFPPGHRDRDLTINQILYRDYQEKCHSGGVEEKSLGLADGDTAAAAGTSGEKRKEEEDYPEEELDAMLAAAMEENAR